MQQDQVWTCDRLRDEVERITPDAIELFDAFVREAGKSAVEITGIEDPAARVPIETEGVTIGRLYVRLYRGSRSTRSGSAQLEFDLDEALNHGDVEAAEKFMRAVGGHRGFADAERKFAERGAIRRRPNVPLDRSISPETIRSIVRLAVGKPVR